jgi:hypothetical protein
MTRNQKMSTVVLIECRRLRSDARDQICEVLQIHRKEVARCLVYEAPVSVEPFVRVRDEHLRLEKGVRVCEYKGLPQLGLASRGSRHPRRSPHHGGGLTIQRAIAAAWTASRSCSSVPLERRDCIRDTRSATDRLGGSRHEAQDQHRQCVKRQFHDCFFARPNRRRSWCRTRIPTTPPAHDEQKKSQSILHRLPTPRA